MPNWIRGLTVAVLAMLPMAAATQNVPEAPILRVETGMHAGSLNRIDTDAAGRLLISASSDGTARLWDAETGELLRVLRMPRGAGRDGAAYTAALSPDGRIAAVAGWARYGGDSHSLFLFDTQSGQMLRSVPGFGNVIHELAFSPDGRFLAVGGHGTSGVSVLETANWSRAAHLGGYGERVHGLAWDAGGRLATSSWDGNLRIYGTIETGVLGVFVQQVDGVLDVTETIVGGPAERAGIRVGDAITHLDDRPVLGLGWDQVVDLMRGPPGTGLVVTLRRDGVDAPIQVPVRRDAIKLDHQLLTSAFLGEDALPRSLAFSPDGSELALGFDRMPWVELRNSGTLDLLHEADAEDGMIAVVWSADGRQLLAGGRGRTQVDGRWSNLLHVWSGAGRGPAAVWPAARSTILDLAALPDGDVVVAGADLARLSSDGTRRWAHAPALPDWSAGATSHLRLASDGLGVGMTPLGEAPLRFNPVARRLDEGAAPGTWPEAREEGGAMSFPDWRFNQAPTLNGHPLGFLDPHERAVSVSVAQAGDFAVLGADWHLYGIAPDGGLHWRVPVPGVAWQVNLAEDGRTVAAALGDGTIRWYRAADGAELLALFVHADRSRWVAWTPSGYYDASPGGEELIGWHVNRGLDQAPDFFPAYVFRDRYHQPEVVSLILETLEEAEALAQADARQPRRVPPAAAPLAEVLPPVLRVLAPERDAPVAGDAVTLDLDVVTAPDAPLTGLRARVNGRSVPEARIDGARVTVSLPAIDDPEIYLTLLGQNRHGLGEPVDLRLRRAETQGGQGAGQKPMLYVLAIGVSDYADPELRLNYAAKDAQDIAALFAGQSGPLYRDVEVRLVTDAEATFSGVRAGLGWLRREMTDLDTALIFVAGHGVNDSNGDLYFLTHESDVEALFETAVEATMFTDTIQRLPGRVIYMMDTCHSGNLEFVRRGASRIDLNRHLQDLRAATGAVVFSSAMGSQYALESPVWGNGAFTLAMIEGLGGAADFDGDGAITVSELNAYVSTRVKALTNNRQTPILRLPDEVRDFPMAMLR